MKHTLLAGISSKVIQAYLDTMRFSVYRNREPYFKTFFPWKFTTQLTYETLIGSNNLPVAANVVALDSSAPLKTRRVIEKLLGDLQPIMIKRQMDAKDLKEYDALKSLAENPDENALLDLIYNDIDFCMVGCLSMLEIIALKVLNCQQVTFNSTINDAGIQTEHVIDFRLPATNKRVIKSASANRTWDNETTAKPVTDIQDVVEAAEDLGYSPGLILMNSTKFREFSITDQVINYSMPYTGYAKVKGTVSGPAPSLSAINQMLETQGLPQIMVIKSRITVESKTHTQTTLDPFTDLNGTDKYITFLPSRIVGNMYYTTSPEETHKPEQVIQSKRDNVLISKYSDVDPVAEYTKGEIIAFPSAPTIDSWFRLNTEDKDATGLES